MAAFLGAFFIWLFATGNFQTWLDLAASKKQ